MIALIAINLQALELMAAIKFRTVSSHLGKEETYRPIDAPQIGRDATADRADLLGGWPPAQSLAGDCCTAPVPSQIARTKK